MSTGMLLERINAILDEDDLKPEEIAGKIATAMAVYNRELIREFQSEIAAVRALIAANGRMINDMSLLVRSADDNQKSLDVIGRDVLELKNYNRDHPSLLWLLRYRTKTTVAVIVLVSIVLIALSSSDVFMVVAKFLGF